MKKILFALLLVFMAFPAYADEVLVDSMSEAGVNFALQMGDGTNCNLRAGQAITLTANKTIVSVTLYLKKTGTITGSATIALKATTGTVGSSAVPTGADLATATFDDVSVLTTSYELRKFTFSSSYAASAGDICIELRYSGTTDPSNHLDFGGITGGAGHAGNGFDYVSSYTARHDYVFYLYEEVESAGQIIMIN